MNDQSAPGSTFPTAAAAPAVACGVVPGYQARMAVTALDDNLFLCGKTVEFVMNFLKHDTELSNDENSFEFIAYVLGESAVLALARTVCRTIHLPSELRDRLEPGRGSVPNILMWLWREQNAEPPLKEALLAALAEERDQVNQLAATAKDDVFALRFAEMVRLFALNNTEADLLLLAYVRYADIWRWSEIGIARNSSHRFQRIRLLCQALDLRLGIVSKSLWPTGRLHSLQCLDRDFEFNPDLEPFLIGLADEPLASRFFVRVTDSALPWAMYGQLSERYGTLLKDLIIHRDPSRGLNILLYGPPGTGKTSFAVSLAAELEMDLYRIRVQEEGECRAEESRLVALKICDCQVSRQRGIILIDEADALLTRSRGDPFRAMPGGEPVAGKETGSLNTFLDAIKTPCIWITNAPPAAIAEASRRRFDYSIEFKPLLHRQRCQVWKNLLSQYHLKEIIDDAMVEQLARQFPVSAGGVDLALRHYTRLRSAASAPLPADTLERLLTPHCQLLGIDIAAATGKTAGGYALAGLNVRGQVSPQRLLAAVRKFRRNQELAEFTAEKAGQDAPHLTALLSGPPGTGKTQFVKFMGREVDCPVRTCTAGDLLNRYVGGTEKNIREAFRDAAADRAILFIDEADGLFYSRQLAHRSWEITQVNVLLHAMENFAGILVCATNSVETLDPATIRRFTFKLEFDYLNAAGKLTFYQRILSELCQEPMTEPAKRRLTNIADLTPGDFATVRQGMDYPGSSDGSGITHAALLSALEQESDAKRLGRLRNFGFGRE